MKFKIGDCIKDNGNNYFGTGLYFLRARILDIYLKDERIKYKIELLSVYGYRMYALNYGDFEVNQKELEYNYDIDDSLKLRYIINNIG